MALACSAHKSIMAFANRNDDSHLNHVVNRNDQLFEEFRNRDVVNTCLRFPGNAQVCFHRCNRADKIYRIVEAYERAHVLGWVALFLRVIG